MHELLIAWLACPACHGELTWTIQKRRAPHIESAEAQCRKCASIYPVRDGIRLFLTPDLPREDLWEQTESGLVQHVRTHPAVERQLLDVPLERLNPADQLFRAFVLEARGDFAAAKHAEAQAMTGLYTPAYRDCWQWQVEDVLARVAASAEPIIDLASGRACCAVTVRGFNRLDWTTM